VLAQLGMPDMGIPILYALTYPDRLPCPAPALDLVERGTLTFEAPDETAFPCLALARQAGCAGGAAPLVLNAANEVAVAAFLGRRLNFAGIAGVIESVLQQHESGPVQSLEDALAADAWARGRAESLLSTPRAAGA
jgi:1-deoxy-D-xylulose-5-phosphate reductoisomerase